FVVLLRCLTENSVVLPSVCAPLGARDTIPRLCAPLFGRLPHDDVAQHVPPSDGALILCAASARVKHLRQRCFFPHRRTGTRAGPPGSWVGLLRVRPAATTGSVSPGEGGTETAASPDPRGITACSGPPPHEPPRQIVGQRQRRSRSRGRRARDG